MSITEQITDQISESMKARSEKKTSILRMLKSALQNATIAKSDHSLTNQEEIAVLRQEIKKRQQSADLYRQGGRPELADKEQSEIEMIREFLPEPISEVALIEIIKQAITETGASSAKDLGMVIKAVQPAVQGRADNTRIVDIIRERLA